MSTPTPLSGKVHYDKIKYLGEGSFGVVHQYQCKRTNDFVAIKKIRLKQAQAGINISAIRELKTLQELDHPNVIKIRDVFAHKSNIYLVLDFMTAELEQIIKDKRGVELTTPHIKGFMVQLLQGIQYLHENWIVHRDIKPGNILVDAKRCVKIADFGLARSFGSPDRSMSHQAATRWYRSPELLFGSKQYGGAVDMWSLGCIFAEMMLRVAFLQGDTDINQLTTIFGALGTPTEEHWPEMKYLPDYFTVDFTAQPCLKRAFMDWPDNAVGLLSGMLQFNPDKRLSAADALRQPYFHSAPARTAQELLPMPQPKNESKDTHSSDRYSRLFNGMGPPRPNFVAKSPIPLLNFPTPDMRPHVMASERPTPDDVIARLHFPTPDGGASGERLSLDNSLDSSFEGRVPQFTPASIDTCGMPRVRANRNVLDSEERGKIRKRKLDMDQALEDAATEDPTIPHAHFNSDSDDIGNDQEILKWNSNHSNQGLADLTAVSLNHPSVVRQAAKRQHTPLVLPGT